MVVVAVLEREQGPLRVHVESERCDILGRRQIRLPDATSYAVSGQPVYRVWPSGLSASPWRSLPVGIRTGGVDGERRSQTTA